MKTGNKGCYKKGGKVKHHMETLKEERAEHHHYKKGGKVHEAHGHKSKKRLDKRARGGRMTPSSPLSGAEPKGIPGAGSKSENN